MKAKRKPKPRAPDVNKGGRPRIDLTPAQVAEIPTLAAVLTQEQMADYFGLHERTLRLRFSESPEVLAAYKKGRAAGIEGIARNLSVRAMGGDTTAAIFYLKTQAGWKETSVVQNQDLPAIEVK